MESKETGKAKTILKKNNKFGGITVLFLGLTIHLQ